MVWSMIALPDPIWPVLVLALIQLVDGVLSWKPVPFVAKCFDDVHFPREWWWIFGRNLFVNATGMLVICVATGLWSFVL